MTPCALDLWVQQWRRRRALGDIIIVRYADDFMLGFQRAYDAKRLLGHLRDVLRQLKNAKPQLLAIDEIHHLLARTPREQRAALNVVKFLSNELRVSITALGTSEALHVMRTDPQIASRFESCALPSWIANEQLRSFVAGFLQQVDIESGDPVNNQVAMDYLLELTSGVTGRIGELLRLGACCALRRDSRILSIGCLQKAGKEFAADLGSERDVGN